ncbi:MAG: hypothetical protein AB7M05_06310 [Alphaproteobacteria bacterium]
MQNLFTRLGRLAAAAALSTAVGFSGVAAYAQGTAPAPSTMGTTNATTSGAASAGATQKMQDDQMKKDKAEKKAKKAKKDAKPPAQ